MKKQSILVLFLVISGILMVRVFSAMAVERKEEEVGMTNREGRPLVVISAPSVHDTYYAQVFDQIMEYDVEFASSVMGKDNVIILADQDTLPFLEGRVPDDILLEAEVYDIWIRDFSTVLPTNPVKFSYRPNYLTTSVAREIEDSFMSWSEQAGLSHTSSDLILDGGNLVDNGHDKGVITERIFSDNASYSRQELETMLKQSLGVSEIAFIPEEEGDTTGHADGMVMWVSQNKLLVHQYEEPFRSQVLNALSDALTNVEIVEVPYHYEFDEWKGFASACGIYLNSTVSDDYIYAPIFGTAHDDSMISLIRSHTDKQVVPINAANVCFMGGSVRCLSWQVAGEQADHLIALAREKSAP
ncbi:MAG: agmatine deiminase family protein [Ardenticatenaceae bacterium]